MTDEERNEEEVKLPEDAVEDLEPKPEEGAEVTGGQVYNWWKKVEGGTG